MPGSQSIVENAVNGVVFQVVTDLTKSKNVTEIGKKVSHKGRKRQNIKNKDSKKMRALKGSSKKGRLKGSCKKSSD